MTKKPRTIKSVKNVFEIISMLKQQKRATAQEIADQMDLTKGTVHTYLVTLRQEGYVEKTDDGKYRLGLKFIHLGSFLREDLNIYKHGKNEADKLAQQTGDVVGLSTETQGVVRMIYSTRGDPSSFKGSTPTGGILPIHASAAGKAVLATFTDEQVNEIIDETGLPQLTPHTITERDQLFEELAAIREQGYALNAEEQTVGAQTFAIDVQRPNGTLGGIVAISGTVSRFANKDKEALLSKLRETANQIEINIQRGLSSELD